MMDAMNRACRALVGGLVALGVLAALPALAAPTPIVLPGSDGDFEITVPDGWSWQPRVVFGRDAGTIEVHPVTDMVASVAGAMAGLQDAYLRLGVRLGSAQKAPFDDVDARWAEAPGSDRPLAAVVGSGNRYFVVNVRDRSRAQPGLRDALFAVLRTVRAAAVPPAAPEAGAITLPGSDGSGFVVTPPPGWSWAGSAVLSRGETHLYVYPADNGGRSIDDVLVRAAGGVTRSGRTARRAVTPAGPVAWVEAPGTARPYVGVLGHEARFFVVRARDDAGARERLREPFVAVLKSLRPLR
jgi:hypothetical protein